MLVIGLISGTSADGVDVAIVDIKGKEENIRIKEKAFRTYKFPPSLQDEIFRVSHRKILASEISELNFRLGKFFAESALKLVRESGTPLHQIELIGSHGQTISHIPGIASLQIAEPSVIARITGKTTIADFRPADISAGGEGAPLACLLHYYLFRKKGVATLVVNIGGISNFTLIPPNCRKEDVIAFDTGPGNMIIDSLVRIKSGGRMRYDHKGKIAEKGEIIPELLEKLMSHPFIHRLPPKSTGREEFGEKIAKRLFSEFLKGLYDFHDLIATVTAFTSESIYLNYEKFIKRHNISKVVITGGGVKNNFLIKQLKKRFHPTPVFTFEDFGLNGDSTEAVAFALLAYETYHGRPGNLPSATGAKEAVVLGKIVKP